MQTGLNWNFFPLVMGHPLTHDVENYAVMIIVALLTARENVTMNFLDTNDDPHVGFNWLLTEITKTL